MMKYRTDEDFPRFKGVNFGCNNTQKFTPRYIGYRGSKLLSYSIALQGSYSIEPRSIGLRIPSITYGIPQP